MKKLVSMFTVIFTLLTLLSCNSTKKVSSATYPSSTSSKKVVSTFNKNEMLEKVNASRAKARMCGNEKMEAVAPIVWNDVLESAAEIHSLDMKNNRFFNHISKSNGSNPKQRIEQTGYKGSAYAENIANGYPSVEAVVEGWLTSPGHCKNIMKANVTEIGVSVKENYWTMVFGKPRI